MSVTYPGESQDYRAARRRLLDKEAELRRSMEEVAALRRELPPGGPLLYGAARPARWRGEHVNQHLSFVVVAKAPPERSASFARERGWRRLRILSSAGTSFNRDYHAETEEGEQRPMLNVFSRDIKSGEFRHFWGSELFYEVEEEGQDPRHVGTLEPNWNMFDLTPAGRGRDWDEQLCYSALRDG